MPRTTAVLLALCAGALCGCPDKKPPATFQSDSHGHSHDGGKNLLVDIEGTDYHAALTAHLSSKDGNELDIFVETIAKKPELVPLPLTKFTATAKAADGKEYKLEFEPSPADERPGDPVGKCSRFTAKAGWMKADDVLTVTATLPIDGKPTPIVWKDFKPGKYAHHQD